MGLRLNTAKIALPSSAKCDFHYPFKYTFHVCLNCKLYFSLCMWREWHWNKVISTSIQKKPDFQKNENKNYFSNSWLSLISKSVSTDTSCRVDLADFLAAPYFHFDWLATVYLREIFSKNKRLGRSMQRIKRPNIGSSSYWSALYSDWLI